jgi:hypothetical protein
MTSVAEEPLERQLFRVKRRVTPPSLGISTTQLQSDLFKAIYPRIWTYTMDAYRSRDEHGTEASACPSLVSHMTPDRDTKNASRASYTILR